MIFISYYTKDTPYEAVAHDYIIPSYKKFNLKHKVEAIDDLLNWQANTVFKSTFIKKCLLEFKESVVFLDCDAEIVKYPQLFFNVPIETDIGYFSFNWYHHWRNQPENTSNIQLLSGTLYFGYNEKVLNLIDEWIKTAECSNEWEQTVLQNIVYARNDLNVFKFPAEYCCVVMQDYSIPKYINDPVIIHWQASRKYKNRKNWEQ